MSGTFTKSDINDVIRVLQEIIISKNKDADYTHIATTIRTAIQRRADKNTKEIPEYNKLIIAEVKASKIIKDRLANTNGSPNTIAQHIRKWGKS